MKDIPTLNISNYIKEKHITVTRLAAISGVSYSLLYDSLKDKTRDRPLRAEEYLKICIALGRNPMEFYQTKNC